MYTNYVVRIMTSCVVICYHKTAIAAEAAVEKKVAWIRNDQERRVVALEERQDKMLRHAQLAEAWADEVEKVLLFILLRSIYLLLPVVGIFVVCILYGVIFCLEYVYFEV